MCLLHKLVQAATIRACNVHEWSSRCKIAENGESLVVAKVGLEQRKDQTVIAFIISCDCSSLPGCAARAGLSEGVWDIA